MAKPLQPNDVLIITGHLWTDTYGNTYHVAYVDVIYADGTPGASFESAPTSGYGDSYAYTAASELIDRGYLTMPDDGEIPQVTRWLRDELKLQGRISSVHVDRKKDL